MPMRHWDEKSLRLLRQSQDFSNIGKIALDILGKMPQPASQVCGPISTGGLGTVRKNMMVFQTAIQVLLCRKVNVFNQMPLQAAIEKLVRDWSESNSGYCWEILECIYAPIFESGLIKKAWFIPGWEDSVGSRWEHEKCQECGVEIIHIPKDWIFLELTLGA